MEKFLNWVEKTRCYPPVYIFEGQPKGKAEKNAEAACENLYKLNWTPEKPNVLGNLYSAWREVEVLIKLFDGTPYQEKALKAAFGDLRKATTKAIKKMDTVFAQTGDLSKYYSAFKMTDEEAQQLIGDMYGKLNLS